MTDIKEHMEIIGADGVHVGTVDKIEGNRIKLTKKDSGEGSHKGHHHYIDRGLVAGIEGDINAKSGSSSLSARDSNIFRAEAFAGSASQGGDGSIRGRLGWLVTPWTLVYGTGGVAFGHVSGSFAYTAHEIDGLCGFVCASATGGGSWSTTRTGATGGGGVETFIAPNMTLRLEYRYTDLGTFSENVPLHTVCGTTCTSSSNNAQINLHPTFQNVTVGIALNF